MTATNCTIVADYRSFRAHNGGRLSIPLLRGCLLDLRACVGVTGCELCAEALGEVVAEIDDRGGWRSEIERELAVDATWPEDFDAEDETPAARCA